MSSERLSVVTGAFGYTGRYITELLLDGGHPVKTLTGHLVRPNPFGDRLSVAPLSFDEPDALRAELDGADTLYNTYWIRFGRGDLNFDRAVENSRTLVSAARDAGVRRIVHISVSKASSDSSLPYFRGKGLVEEAVAASGLSYGIVRPTLIFGKEDVLLNNIAWSLRRIPAFPIFGSGDYRVQPVYVKDVARLSVDLAQHTDDTVVDAVGPEIYTFEELVKLVANAIGSRTRLVHIAPSIGYYLTKIASLVLRDVVLTRDEIAGLMDDLLVSDGKPTGPRSLEDWLADNRESLGTSYRSELQRHYR